MQTVTTIHHRWVPGGNVERIVVVIVDAMVSKTQRSAKRSAKGTRNPRRGPKRAVNQFTWPGNPELLPALQMLLLGKLSGTFTIWV